MHKQQNNYSNSHKIKKLFKKIFNPDGKNMIPEEQDVLDYLMLNGGMEVVGIDGDSGELLYSFTPKIENLMPELYSEHLKHVNKEIMNLWEKGFLYVDLMEDDPNVVLSEKSFDLDEISKLSKQEQWSIGEIKRMLKA